MSIRHLATDLYRSRQKVEKLEKALAAAAPSELVAIEDELRRARAELQLLRKMLDGEKETGLSRSRSFFSREEPLKGYPRQNLCRHFREGAIASSWQQPHPI